MKLIFTFLIAVVCVPVWAQETGILSGTISTTTVQPIPGATIRVLNTTIGTSTNEAGEFRIEGLNRAKYTLEISALGYASVKKEVDLSGIQEYLRIQLVESVRQLDAVIVTAEKKEEDIQKIPSSISNISSRQVEQYRMWNAKDITAIAPNVYSANPGDNRNVTSIRGVTTTSYDPAVATYIDGVNQFNLDTYIAPIFDVERIEVLRGPQGTLYGRNAMGGVINIITKEPTNILHGFGEINIGSHGQQRYTLGIRAPLIANKLFLGVAGMYDKSDGFYTNTFNNTDFDKKHSFTGNYYLKYLATPRLSVTLNVKNHSNRNDGAFALSPDPETAFDEPFKVEQNALTTLIDNVFNTSLNIQHAGSIVNFTSLTTYQSNHRYYENPIDGDFSPADIITINNNYGKDWNNVKVWTQEFKFTSSPSSSPWQWTAGSYLFHQNSPNKQATNFGENGDLFGAQPNTSILNTTEATSRGIAFYGQAIYSVNKYFDITVGARYDYEHKKQRVLGEYLMNPDPTPIFETQPDTSATASYNAFSPKLGLTYNITEDHHLYGVYSRGYRTGGFTQLSSDPSQPPLYQYKPEFSNNFEIGIKNNILHNRVRLNISAFYIKVIDAQVPTLVLPQALTVTQNAGELTSKGFEMELSATPSKGIQIDYSLGYTDAKYDELTVPNQGNEVDLTGNRQVFTPEVTSMLAVQFSPQISEWQSLKFVVRGEAVCIGDQYFDLANTIKQSSYGLFNGRAGFSGTNFELMFWIRNISDERYISYAYDFGGTHLGDPRNLGVTLRAMF
ncbi:MAG TPA: TonB-dependent receptor [Chryseolinea sp.]|nr:TonB-dependent receptor [Chryseolinea sp.]